MNSNFQLPWPAAEINKYSRGRLTVIAGSSCYPGAAALAARAAQRTGTGYVQVITSKQVVTTVRLAAPSLVVRSLSGWDIDELPEATNAHPCAVCIGPGFIPGKRGRLVLDVLRQARCPVLVDAGALQALGKGALAVLSQRDAAGFSTVLTPHGGEAARLAELHQLSAASQQPAKTAQTDLTNLASDLALMLSSLVVLKGSNTFISNGHSTECVTKGTPALAKAGTGDVLAGIIGALLAQGANSFTAAFTGVTLHALAGIAAAETYTNISTCPEDVIEAIPLAIKALE